MNSINYGQLIGAVILGAALTLLGAMVGCEAHRGGPPHAATKHIAQP